MNATGQRHSAPARSECDDEGAFGKPIASVVLGLCCALAACANLETPYQAFDRSLTSFGGYQDAVISDGVYEVRIYINEFTGDQTGNSYLERRSNELCREKGFQRAVYIGEQSYPPPAPAMRGRAVRIRCAN